MAARPYADQDGRAACRTSSRAPKPRAHPLLARHVAGRKRLVVITADKGLCGAFNSNILRASLALPARAGRRRRADAGRGGQEGARLLSPAPVDGEVRDARLLRPPGLRPRAGARRRAHAGVPRRTRWTRSTSCTTSSARWRCSGSSASSSCRSSRQRRSRGQGTPAGDYIYEPSPDAILAVAAAAPRHHPGVPGADGIGGRRVRRAHDRDGSGDQERQGNDRRPDDPVQQGAPGAHHQGAPGHRRRRRGLRQTVEA